MLIFFNGSRRPTPSKTCDLDPYPTELLKYCLDVLLVPITQMINLSLISRVFPDIFKTAHVMSLLKKPSLSKDDIKITDQCQT